MSKSLTWDVKCTWRVYGTTNGPNGAWHGYATIRAPDPDSALEIAQKNQLMYDITKVKHLSGSPGRLGS